MREAQKKELRAVMFYLEHMKIFKTYGEYKIWPQRETPNSDLEDTSGNHFELILGSWLPEEPTKILSKKWFQKHEFYRSKCRNPPFLPRRNAREGHKVLYFTVKMDGPTAELHSRSLLNRQDPYSQELFGEYFEKC